MQKRSSLCKNFGTFYAEEREREREREREGEGGRNISKVSFAKKVVDSRPEAAASRPFQTFQKLSFHSIDAFSFYV